MSENLVRLERLIADHIRVDGRDNLNSCALFDQAFRRDAK